MNERIKISSRDVNDPKVDAVLAEQQSFGFAAPSSDNKQSLIFKPWFSLMLAGLVGGFSAWAIIEPYFDDGIRFTGSVETINQMDRRISPEISDTWIQVQGVKLIIPTKVNIELQNGKNGNISDISIGQGLEVLVDIKESNSTNKIGFVKHISLISSEKVQNVIDLENLKSKHLYISLLMFPLSAAFIGLFIGAADGILSRAWRRAFVSSAVGLGVGFFAGLLALIPAGLIFNLGQSLAIKTADENSLTFTGGSLLLHIMGRGLAWAVIGIAAGIGQGVAMRSKKLLLNGIIGGVVGGLLGGVLFDPIEKIFSNISTTGGAELSRMIGISLIGAGIGLMIGLVELLARESWVRILTGPIAGKEFILYRNPTWIGSSPKCEIYLFKDPLVAPRHASIQRVGEFYEIEDKGSPSGTILDNKLVKRSRIKDKNRITIGKTIFEFRMRDE